MHLDTAMKIRAFKEVNRKDATVMLIRWREHDACEVVAVMQSQLELRPTLSLTVRLPP